MSILAYVSSNFSYLLGSKRLCFVRLFKNNICACSSAESCSSVFCSSIIEKSRLTLNPLSFFLTSQSLNCKKLVRPINLVASSSYLNACSLYCGLSIFSVGRFVSILITAKSFSSTITKSARFFSHLIYLGSYPRTSSTKYFTNLYRMSCSDDPFSISLVIFLKDFKTFSVKPTALAIIYL